MCQQGSSKFQWYGHSVVFLTDTSERLLAIGSPTYHDCSGGDACVQSAGKVTIFDLDKMESVAELVGERDYQQFGYSLAAGKAIVNGIETEVHYLSMSELYTCHVTTLS